MAVYALFADILDYPDAALRARLGTCVTELARSCPDAAEFLGKFEEEQAPMTLGELQELYTGTFELQPDCTPNLGYHLFGNDARRNVFMAKLKERMERHHVAIGSELPDHLCLILRLLEKEQSEEERSALMEDCLAPAVARMVDVLRKSRKCNPYESALRALLILLQEEGRAAPVPLGTSRAAGNPGLR